MSRSSSFRRRWAFASLLLIGSGLVSPAFAQGNDALIQQGKAVATAGDCAACHTDNDAHPYAGGRGIGSPMGEIYASNITPSSTGIAGWTEQQFADALRKGINAKGEHLYPAMPYTSYAGISDADMHALYTYFMQLPADESKVPGTQLSFPYNQRWLMAGWNLLFLKSGPVQPDATLSAQQNRGQYLVDTLGHCSSCHSPRNVLMGEKTSAYLGGAKIDGWIAPNITSDPVSGIGSWTTEEIAAYLKTGHVKGKGQAGGGMAEAVQDSLRYMSDEDLYAIASYLKTVKPIHDDADSKPAYAYAGGEPLPGLTAQEKQRPDNADDPEALRKSDTTDGAELYGAACASCHQPSGDGTKNQYFPSLSHNRAVGMSTPDNLVMAILHGVNREGADLHVSMPGFKRDMNDAQVAAVANYVEQHFGNPSVHVTQEQVATIRAGGPKPLLLVLTPWLLGLGVIVILLCVFVTLRFLFREKRRNPR